MSTNASSKTPNPTMTFESSDIFNVERTGRDLTRIIEKTKANTIVLDGPWGSGKTFFIRQWQHALLKAKYRVVYWDAFQSDHQEDALFPILGKLVREAGASEKDRKSLCVTAGKIVAALPNALLTAASSSDLTLNITKRLLIFGGKAVIEATNAEDSTRLFERRLERAREEEECLHDFREALDKLVPPPPRPLIFIIDELDRCHPPFALNVLERIKHLFENRKIRFVLVTHLAELAEMVGHAYGLANPRRYLEKFHQLTVSIDNILYSGDEAARATYVAYLLDADRFNGNPGDRRAIETLENLAEIHSISLRTLELIVWNYELYVQANRWASFGKVSHIAAALCVMRLTAPDLYREASANQLRLEDARAFLGLEHWEMRYENDKKVIHAWWRLMTGVQDTSDEDIKRRMQSAESDYQHEIDSNTNIDAVKVNEALGAICKGINVFWQAAPGGES